MISNFNYEESVEEFLLLKNNPNYKSCMCKFSKFLKCERKVYDMVLTYFQGIRSDELIESLKYYILQNDVTSFGAANTYASCIQEYFKTIISRGLLKNDELMSEFSYPIEDSKSCRGKINKYLSSEEQIKESIKSEPMSDEEVLSLIEDCDKVISNLDSVNKAIRVRKDYNKFRSSIILKLITITGITYRCLVKIRYENLDITHGEITINSLEFHLPNKLIDDLELYKKVRTELLNKNSIKSDILFVEYNGSPISTGTSITSGFLITYTGRGELNGIIKYSIINLIKNGINQSIIEKLTEIGVSIYNYCQDQVNNAMDYKTSRYLDSKIRSLEIFDKL